MIRAAVVVVAVLAGCASPAVQGGPQGNPFPDPACAPPCGAAIETVGEPRALALAVDPRDPEHLVLARRSMGACEAAGTSSPDTCPLALPASVAGVDELRAPPQTRMLEAQVSTDGGSTWTPSTFAARIASRGDAQVDVAILSDGTVLLVTLADSMHTANDHLAILTSDDGGRTFGAATLLAPASSRLASAENPLVAYHGAEVLVVWEEEETKDQAGLSQGPIKTSPAHKRMFSASADGGASWTPPTEYARATTEWWGTRLVPAMSADNWAVADLAYDPACRFETAAVLGVSDLEPCVATVEIHVSRDRGLSWAVVGTDLRSRGGFSFAVDGDAWIVAFASADEPPQLVLARSVDQGATWSTTVGPIIERGSAISFWDLVLTEEIVWVPGYTKPANEAGARPRVIGVGGAQPVELALRGTAPPDATFDSWGLAGTVDALHIVWNALDEDGVHQVFATRIEVAP